MESPDLTVDVDPSTHVAVLTIRRPPNNFFDTELIRGIADQLEGFAADDVVRVAVVASEGKHFCAGRDFSRPRAAGDGPGALYREAARLIAADTPWIAAIQGAAVGGGLGLALAADLRVATPNARLSANFARLGFHHGFGLTVLLPRLVGEHRATDLLMTGARVDGARALDIGLVDHLVEPEELSARATQLAEEIASSAPLAVRAIRRTMRAGLVERFQEATEHEVAEQARLRETADHAEGVAAGRERRTPHFTGR